jgi:hypothetical protein
MATSVSQIERASFAALAPQVEDARVNYQSSSSMTYLLEWVFSDPS